MKIVSEGKVREIYGAADDALMIVTTDRVSAFDVIMPDLIPDKGKLLNLLSEFWFDYTADIVPNHVITTKFDEFPAEFKQDEFRDRSMLVKKLKMLPVECIVRGYITGSGWQSYQQSGTVCGIKLPEGMQESQKLPETLFTPSTKAEIGDHDENISFARVCEMIGNALAEKLRDTSLAVYKKCADYALTKGIIIADTKFEFGLDEKGTLILADEMLTPDSSRFWAESTFAVGRGQDSFDKQYLRDWLKDNGYKGGKPEHLPQDVIDITRGKYVEAYERITGKKFE
jgi:phosphoribosylaminoimidazole-succinocarboxamide synthase